MAVEEEEAIGIPEWVVTFGDMMSLLLTFFIMLVSLSEIKEEEKYQAMVESMKEVFGYDSSRLSMIPGSSKPRNSMVSRLAVAGRAKRLDLMQGGNPVRATKGDDPTVRMIREGERTGTGAVVHFDGESIEPTKKHREALMEIKPVIGGKPQIIVIRGHTSGRPLSPHSSFRDHHDLAYERCRKVYEFLREEMEIDEHRCRLSVAGSNEPKFLTPDPEKQRQNARVEVFMVNETVRDRAGTKDEQLQLYKDAGQP